MSKPRRWVIVDATSPDIKYNGTWFTDHGSFDSVGIKGPPYLSTLRGTSNNASFAFNFAGPGVSVMGSNLAQNGSYAKWACFVDGTSFTADPVSTVDENNRYLCSKYGMDDGPHSVTVRAIVDTNQTFWFDRIQYLPSPGLSLTNVTTAVWSSDSAPKWDSSWTYKENTCRMTTQHGSMVTLDFYGMSLSWYGVVLPGYTGNATTGTWSVDDTPGRDFTINGYAVNDAGVFNQKLFDTSVYPVGTHRLKVTYNGDSTKTPLAMGYMLIHNSSIDSGSTSSTGSSMSTAIIHPTSSSANIGVAIGGTMGGATILAIAIFLFIFYRRRRRRKLREEWNEFHESSISTAPPEFNTPVVLPSQKVWRKPVAAIHSQNDGGDSTSLSSRLVNRVGGKARVNKVVELRQDSQGSSEPGAMPQSKAQAAANLVGAAGQSESIHRDNITAPSPNPFSVVTHLDTDIPSTSQAPASSGDLPPEYTLN